MFTARYVLHSTFCPHGVFMCFVWIWVQTAIISLYSISWLVFITKKECVYCAVRSTFYVLPTQCIYVFCEYLRTNSDYFPTMIVFIFKSRLSVFTERYDLDLSIQFRLTLVFKRLYKITNWINLSNQCLSNGVMVLDEGI